MKRLTSTVSLEIMVFYSRCPPPLPIKNITMTAVQNSEVKATLALLNTWSLTRILRTQPRKICPASQAEHLIKAQIFDAVTSEPQEKCR